MLNFIHHDMLISGICTALPGNKKSAENFKERFGNQLVNENIKKLGFLASRISIAEQTASDLGFEAVKNIFDKKNIDPDEVGFVVTVTRTPDYRSPATSTVLHYRLGLSKDCICYDMNIGGAGFIYGLNAGLALLENINKNYGVLIIGDTTSKLIDKQDPLSMHFSDGASAVLLNKSPGIGNKIDISTAANGHLFQTIINSGGAFRNYIPIDNDALNIDHSSDQDKLCIDEAEFQKISKTVIPDAINKYLAAREKNISKYDLLAIHQETKDIIEHISRKLDFDAAMLIGNLMKYGNTVGNSIPMVLTDVYGKTSGGEIDVLACGYGEGLSWGIADFKINVSNIFPLIETNNYFSEVAVSHDF